MFGFFKTLFSAKRLMREYEDRNKAYLTMPHSGLKALTDNELFSAVLARTEAKVDRFDDLIDGVRSLSDAERTFYVASYYEAEVNNGGLCQFFVNSSRVVAPLLSDCLSAIGAAEHRKLFESFVTKNAINLSDLSSFMIGDISDYQAQTKRYPFDEFDKAFYAMTPVQEYLVPYIREHLSGF